MKFREKSRTVEAEQFWNDAPWPKGVCDCSANPRHFGTAHFHHLGGAIVDVNEGDWIINDDGYCYPMKDGPFREKYEEVP